MPETIRLPWVTGGDPILGPKKPGEKNRNKVKYSCECGLNLWGKPGLRVACIDCESAFAEVE